MQKGSKGLGITVLLISIVLLTQCNPTRLPGLRQIAKRQEERITKETEEAIKRSSKLQELDHLCTQEIPHPVDAILIKRYRDFRGETFLGYGYHSKADYQNVKRFYTDHFADHGWQLTYQKDSGWGPRELEFHKDAYTVKVYEAGGEPIKYFLHCEKLSTPGKE